MFRGDATELILCGLQSSEGGQGKRSGRRGVGLRATGMSQDMTPSGHGSFLEWRVRSVFPELPWLLKGQALLGPYFHVASPGR